MSLFRFFDQQLLTTPYFHNTLQGYLVAFGVFVVLLALFALMQILILSRLQKLAKRTRTSLDDSFLRVVRTLKPPFYSFIAFYIAIQFLYLTDILRQIVNVILVIWVVYQIIVAVQIVVDYVITKRFIGEEEKMAESAVGVIRTVIKVTLWLLGTLFVLSNIGVNVSSFLAGLGIGGIAIAFALQNILGDLFSSFAIFFDKPFKEGDFIIVGDKMGTVQKIGIKTTRLKSLQGEEVILSNQYLTSAQIQNYKRMETRRIVFSIGVVYETPKKKLEKIPNMLKKIIESEQDVKFSRAHFKSFDAYALTFEVVYIMQNSDYGMYMDTQQSINLKIVEAFEKEDVVMAFPTQTLYIEK